VYYQVFDYSFTPYHVKLVDGGAQRIVNLPAVPSHAHIPTSHQINYPQNPSPLQSQSLAQVTDTLIETGEYFYRYSRTAPTWAFPFTDAISKFSVVPVSESSGASSSSGVRSQLVWLTTVRPTDTAQEALLALKASQDAFKPLIERAILRYKQRKGQAGSNSLPQQQQ